MQASTAAHAVNFDLSFNMDVVMAASHATKAPSSAPNRYRYFDPTRDKLFQFLHRTRGLPVRKITGAPSHCFLGLPRCQQWSSKMNPRILAGVGDDHARSSKQNRDPGALEQRQGDRCKAAAATQTCLVNSDETPDARSRSRPCHVQSGNRQQTSWL